MSYIHSGFRFARAIDIILSTVHNPHTRSCCITSLRYRSYGGLRHCTDVLFRMIQFLPQHIDFTFCKFGLSTRILLFLPVLLQILETLALPAHAVCPVIDFSAFILRFVLSRSVDFVLHTQTTDLRQIETITIG